MQKKIYLIIAATLMLLVTSCKKDFEAINTNPNAPISVSPELLLRHIIYNFGEEMSYEGFVAGNLLGQYFTMIDFNLFDRHSLSEPQVGGNPWPIFYTNLRDNEIILEQAQGNAAFAVYEGPALILKAYLAAGLTDIYGDVPYSEAFRGKAGNISPKYDAQQDIYTESDGILANLDRGIAAIEDYSGAQTLQGDILFNGNLDSWITFANSLKIKALMRISGQVNVGMELSTLYSAGDWINSNAQNASFDFTDGQPNNFRMATLRSGDFNLFILSETMEEILKELHDPRLKVLFRPYGNDSTGTSYAGLLNGPDASATSISVADYSLTGTIFREETGKLDANFLTAWETHFLLAEAAQRGLIAGSAQMHYETAVGLAFEYWHTEMPASYLSTDSAAFGSFGQDPLEQIITQKWIANIINGYEGWIEFRRTGFPQLKAISASLNNGRIPVRMPYPTDEAALNASNYNAVSVDVPVWWDN
ncbi:MAG TPA: SusD/RagB family nutrient-binding outer membrane lipoprotein [Bacteroidetes bacterium]|nr:SusD/RagB family nutrient-binding outer membrane lipoprotein [Bacteroidota bacterium]